MARPPTPEFYEIPRNALVQCDTAQTIGAREVACSIEQLSGGTAVVIATMNFFDNTRQKLRALVIGDVIGGRLVDFPSGERLAVPEHVVEVTNGSPV